MTPPKHVVVIGAGAGGLAAAVDLAVAGVRVTVLEGSAEPGGKMQQVQVEGRAIDTGPTVFTMRWVFEQLFADAGASLDIALPHRPTGLLARHWWPGGACLDLDHKRERSAANIAAFSDASNADGYLRFCRDAQALYQLLRDRFMASQKPNAVKLAAQLGPLGGIRLLGLQPQRSLWRALGSYFTDARLQQLFGRYATYVGSSPLQASSILSLIAHVEQDGVWTLPGGMSSLARSMYQLAQHHGAEFHFQRSVKRIHRDGSRIRWVETNDGEHIDAEAVIFNGDSAALASGLLGGSVSPACEPTSRDQRGLSAITWSAIANIDRGQLAYHNVIFDRHYPTEFNAIFKRRRRPRRPTVYICAQDRWAVSSDDPPASPHAEGDRVLILINAPADGDIDVWSDGATDAAWDATQSVLERAGIELSLRPGHITRTPHWYAQRYMGTGGSLYGRASHGLWSSFQRPSARTAIPGLYLCGGSAHPGPGVPMATLSGRLAAAALLKDG